ncbi:MAG: hypothetical protein IPK19_18720 [Chloroflexi bacterium]|nr:hypothetical protein [Chloroflexota bacterium]
MESPSSDSAHRWSQHDPTGPAGNRRRPPPASARTGDRAALSAIYNAYYPPVYRFIRMRTDAAATAEDLAADVFVELVAALSRGKGPRDRLRGMIFRWPVTCSTITRPTAALPRPSLDEWLPLPVEDGPEAAAPARGALGQCAPCPSPTHGRSAGVLVLRASGMLSLQETADILGKQVNAVKRPSLSTGSMRRAAPDGVSDDE